MNPPTTKGRSTSPLKEMRSPLFHQSADENAHHNLHLPTGSGRPPRLNRYHCHCCRLRHHVHDPRHTVNKKQTLFRTTDRHKYFSPSRTDYSWHVADTLPVGDVKGMIYQALRQYCSRTDTSSFPCRSSPDCCQRLKLNKLSTCRWMSFGKFFWL